MSEKEASERLLHINDISELSKVPKYSPGDTQPTQVRVLRAPSENRSS